MAANGGKRTPSQRAIHFIRMLFKRLDTEGTGKLDPNVIRSSLFFTDPWTETFDFPDCLLSPDDFVSEKMFIDMWTLHCIVDSDSYLSALYHLGFNYHHAGQSPFSSHESSILEIVLKGHVEKVWQKLTGVERVPRIGIKSLDDGNHIIVTLHFITLLAS